MSAMPGRAMTRPTTTYQDVGSLLPAARYARSAQALGAVLSRAERRADLYARLLADWPALVEHVQGEACQIEAMFRACGRAAR